MGREAEKETERVLQQRKSRQTKKITIVNYFKMSPYSARE